jgi:cytochrome c biogenesis factor
MSAGRLAWIIGAAIFILIVNVSLSVAYMVFYSYLINPGRDEQFYQEHIKIAAPYCSIFFGIPLFYFVCRWIGGRWEREFAVKASIFVWIVYLLIDVAVLAAAGLTLKTVVPTAISLTTKLVSAYFGGISTSRKNHSSI